MKQTLLLLLCLCLISCSDDSDEEYRDLSALILKNQAIWKATEISDYSFSYSEQGSDCQDSGDQYYLNRTITVEDNVVVSVYTAAINHYEPELTLHLYYTIDDVFDLMLQTNLQQPKRFSESKTSKSVPLFHDVYGYPVSFYIDLTSQSCDSITYKIDDFH
ncbi:hypothetical protein E2K93_11305 [Thalassotalea sp. HSM 43]|uniref:DUF6174 domain-containing protein n=1 Tax=Thalassotalea sp. HSM 43 TaxID=2552945 RepID=UPI001080409A|nr:DUF6174 domain-containing protein [Thalassotalea sp. HSM 43]QBY04933.1 hypothetical protein E2K93_11305 [Thalassotalea sp. HSM 43]